MPKRFDVVVIGTGAAASTVATRCRAAGWQVAITDSRPFGGTCALRGCDPKKVLVGAGRRSTGRAAWPAGASLRTVPGSTGRR